MIRFAVVVFIRGFLQIPFTKKQQIDCSSYNWLMKWLNAQTKGATHHVSVKTDITNPVVDDEHEMFSFLLAPGVHYIFYGWRLLRVRKYTQYL